MAKSDTSRPKAVRGGSWTAASDPYARAPQLQIQTTTEETQQAASGFADVGGRRSSGNRWSRPIAHIQAAQLGRPGQAGPIPVQLAVPEFDIFVAGHAPTAAIRVSTVQPVQDNVAVLPE